jgi:hypothetical protein
MNTITGWWLSSSDQTKRIEFSTEFLRREIGIRIFSGQEEISSQLARVSKGSQALVFTDSSVSNFKSLDCFPNRSVILFVLSDETYSLALNIRALLNKKVSLVVRNYPLGNFRTIINYPFILYSKLLRGIHYPQLLKLFPRAFASSLYMIFSQILLRLVFILLRKECFHFPLGYDSGFAQNFAQHFKVSGSSSLIEFSLSKVNVSLFPEKQRDFFFMGQRGTFDRQLLLSEAKQLGINLEKVHESYLVGRLNEYQKMYFDGILSSRLSITPPGNYSAHTFRYCESLLVHSYPIGERWVLSDPLYLSRLTFVWQPHKMRTYKLLKYYDNLRAEILEELEQLNQLRLGLIKLLISKTMDNN